MRHAVFAVRDTCIGAYNMPMFFQNRAAAVRALGDAVNRPKDDNMYYQHPEHYQLYYIGDFEDDNGELFPCVPVFVVDCQSLVRS